MGLRSCTASSKHKLGTQTNAKFVPFLSSIRPFTSKKKTIPASGLVRSPYVWRGSHLIAPRGSSDNPAQYVATL